MSNEARAKVLEEVATIASALYWALEGMALNVPNDTEIQRVKLKDALTELQALEAKPQTDNGGLVEALKMINSKIDTAGAERIIASNIGQLGLYFTGGEVRQFRAALAQADAKEGGQEAERQKTGAS